MAKEHTPIGDKLYEILPELYRREDSNIAPIPYPLKRYLKILGTGMDALAKDINDFNNIHNIDLCPDELLDIACNFYGFKFPANTSSATKRRILKVLPSLYQHKGTRKAILYLVRAMFGVTSEIEVYCPRYEEGMTSEELRRIFLKIQVDDTVLDVDSKMENFSTYAEIIRPVNRKFVVSLSTLFNEELQSGWANESNDIIKLKDFYFVDDTFTTLNRFTSNKDRTLALGFHHNILDREGTGVKFIDILKLIDEEFINVSRYITKPAKTNKDRLNTTFQLSASNIVIDKLKDFTDYSVDLSVSEKSVTSLHYLESSNNVFRLNVNKTNKHPLTSSANHHILNTSEEDGLIPKPLDIATFNFDKPKDSYSTLSKSKLNGGLILTHKKHYDIIKINGVIQKII